MSRWRPEPCLVLPEGDDLLAGLARRLDTDPPPRGARLVVLVPGRFVRPLIVPWNAMLQRPAERALFAQACFREVFGELAQGWVIRVDEPAWGQPSLACAMPAALLDGVLALLAERRLKSVSIQPLLVHALNARTEPFASGAGWLALAEPPALTLLLVEQGRVQRVKVLAGLAGQAESLAAREWFALGREGACPRVMPIDASRFATPPLARVA